MDLKRIAWLSALAAAPALVPRVCHAQVTCLTDGGRIICPVSERDPHAIGPLHVANESKVVIRVTEKSPFDDCSLAEVKFTEIKESDPIVTILQLLTKAATGASVPGAASDFSKALGRPTLPTPAQQLYLDLMDFQHYVETHLIDAQAQIEGPSPTGLNALAQEVDGLFAKPPRTSTEYAAAIDPLEKKLLDAVAIPDRSVDAEQIQYASLHDRLKQMIANGIPTTDLTTINHARDVLDVVASQIAALKSNYDAIAAAKTQFRTVVAFLKQTDSIVKAGGAAPFSKDLPLVSNRQQTASTSISCTNTITKKASVPAIPVTVMYEGRPNLSVSVGALLSTIEKQKLGTTAVSTGLNSSGQPTFKSVFAVVDHAPVQVVPFAFLNYRLRNLDKVTDPAKQARYTLHASTGVGVNPNSGSNEVEFFFGLAFGMKKLLVQVGDHVGRFQDGFTGGFKIGDTVPASFPSTLPIHKVYRNRFGIALSYRLPL